MAASQTLQLPCDGNVFLSQHTLPPVCIECTYAQAAQAESARMCAAYLQEVSAGSNGVSSPTKLQPSDSHIQHGCNISKAICAE